MIKSLNREQAPTIIKFFDLCFKQGVVDAYEFHDDIEAREFVARHREAWDFAVLGQPEPYRWDEWRFTLFHWARRAHGLSGFAMNHIYQITKVCPQWFLLPHCMCFYLMGIEEWLDYPEPTKIQIFLSKPKTHWKPMPLGQQKLDKNDIVICMQGFVYDYRRVDEDLQPFSAAGFDGYAQAMHALTRPYGRNKITIDYAAREEV